MNSADKIKKLIKNTKIKTNPAVDKAVLSDLFNKLDNAKCQYQKTKQQNIWRTIMTSKITKLTTAAITLMVSIATITFFQNTATPAWAISQTVEALNKIETLIITGNDTCGSESMPFKLWVKFPENKKDLINLRFESKKQIVVIRQTQAWLYWTDENVVKFYNNVTNSDAMMRDLDFWYEIAKHNPWITGKILSVLKYSADSWIEDYGVYEKTDQNSVFVTCSYEPLDCSFWFVCDLTSKLIVEGKYWRNTNCQGQPAFHATDFLYNQKINDELFSFTPPDGARIINEHKEKEAKILFDQAEYLFQKKLTEQAMQIYQEVYDKYPDFNIAETSLMMIGICYERLGQYEQAIASYKKSINEYNHLKGWIFATYYYLGEAYAKTKQKEKAIEAFENCIEIGKLLNADKNKFPSKYARKHLKKLNADK